MNKRLLATSLLIVLLSAARAWAGHHIWVDFSDFDLDAWSSVNGNNPPKSSDLEAVKRQILANMSEDYATFDLTITTAKPANGRYTWVKILATDAGGLGGCAGAECCVEGDCTGIGSWIEMKSALEVYSGSYSTLPEFTGSNATTARIANGIAGTASHELGHILGLEHCHAADDSVTLGCEGITFATKDKNATWHMMASANPWGLTPAQRATRDRFFSPHSERRLLAGALQLRNHFAPLPNVNGGSGRADLVYGRLSSPSVMKWYARMSSGSAFGGYTEWSPHAGSAGDIFRLADVDKDGRADLVYGRAINPGTMRWYVRKSDGSGFGSPSIWADDAGDVGDLFFVADVDDDQQADLVYSRATSPTKVKWFVRRSDGNHFGSLETWHDDAGDRGDLMYVGEANGVGGADLVYGRVNGSFDVTWYFRKSTGDKFGNAETWANDAGDAGDLFRLGDTTGDGKLDLMYGRPTGLVSLTATPIPASVRWYGRASEGNGFSPVSIWANEAGDEGDCYP